MVLERRGWRVGAGIVVLAVAAGIGYGLCERLSRVELDLDRLAEYAASQDYAVLIQAVQARPVGPEGFRFVVLGDTRSNIGMARRVMGRAAEEAPAFILSNGDIVRRGTVDEYVAHHMRLVQEVAPIPVIPAPGNHEEGPNRDFATFRAVYGGERFAFDYAGCRFVGFNNGDRNGVSGGDLEFLAQELGKRGAAHKFVVMHVPPRYIENYVQSEDGRGFRWNAGKFRKLMADTGVDHVFLGHVHGFATERLDGVRYTITGGGGATLTETLGEAGRAHNFVLVHVAKDGMRAEVLRLEGDQWVRDAIE